MNERPIIQVSEGKIQGITSESVFGSKYFSFKGIPFAQPPVGPLRFKAPQPPLKWDGIRDASKHAGKIAMQNLDFRDAPARVIGSEDCLYLNVYSRTLGGKRPVMFFIHGGGFVEGSAHEYLYGQDYFMDTDAVLVTVSFRLGALGFLNLGHEVASGNQGLRDIIMGLKWVQKNIDAFGGDPNNVTIFGNSSGSTICHLFTLIPAAKGLFHKAILQSGSMFAAINYFEKNPPKNGFKIAKLLGFESEDPVEIVEFLQSVPGDKLIKLEGQIFTMEEKILNGFHDFSPDLDGEYAKDPILPVSFVELLENDADIPIIIGHTKNEALLGFVGKFDSDEHFKFHDDHIETIMKIILHLTDPSRFPEIMKEIRTTYLKNQPITKENVWNLINLITDMFGINYNRKIIDLRNEHANVPTFVYMFTHLGEQPTFYQYDHGEQPVKGVAHADELSYMFNLTYMFEDGEFKYPKEGSPDRLVLERLVRMWYNFSATGNPTSEIDDKYVTTVWKPSTKENLYYLEINADEKLALKDDRELESRKLYDKIRDVFLV